MRIILLAILFILTTNVGLNGKSNDIDSNLSEIIRQARNDEPINWIPDEQLKDADPQQVLSLLALYEKDRSWIVRRMVHLYEVRLARLHLRLDIKREVVCRLVRTLVDPNSGLARHCYEWLLFFTENDFSSESKAILHQALARENINRHHVLICGVANIQEELPHLRELLIDEMAYSNDPKTRHSRKWYFTLGWSARLARARMGVKEDVAKCIKLAELEQDSDERVLRILPDIGYIRQPEAIRYLQKYLESDKRLPPVKPTAPGELYASRVMHILAESLKNYPVKKKEARNYTEQEIDVCRKWMSEQTKWDIIR